MHPDLRRSALNDERLNLVNSFSFLSFSLMRRRSANVKNSSQTGPLKSVGPLLISSGLFWFRFGISWYLHCREAKPSHRVLNCAASGDRSTTDPHWPMGNGNFIHPVINTNGGCGRVGGLVARVEAARAPTGRIAKATWLQLNPGSMRCTNFTLTGILHFLRELLGAGTGGLLSGPHPQCPRNPPGYRTLRRRGSLGWDFRAI